MLSKWNYWSLCLHNPLFHRFGQRKGWPSIDEKMKMGQNALFFCPILWKIIGSYRTGIVTLRLRVYFD